VTPQGGRLVSELILIAVAGVLILAQLYQTVRGRLPIAGEDLRILASYYEEVYHAVPLASGWMQEASEHVKAEIFGAFDELFLPGFEIGDSERM